MKGLLTVSALFEQGAGPALLAVPSFLSSLLLGVPLKASGPLTVVRVGGAGSGIHGAALWPAVVFHVVMAVWCVASLAK